MSTKMTLLSAADSGEILTEAGTSFLKGLFGSKKSATPASTTPKPDTVEKQRPSSLDEYLHQFIADLKGAPSGNDRYVIRMSLADLRGHYLKSGSGGVSFVESLKDEELVEKRLKQRFQLLKDRYSFDSLMSSKYDVAVLIDVPAHITAELGKVLGSIGDINGTRAVLARMMSHRFYVMTLSTSKMKKVASKISPIWDDVEELMDKLDPTSIVVNYPDADDWTSIKRAYVKRAEENDERSAREEEETERKSNKEEPAPAPAPAPEPAPSSPKKSIDRTSLDYLKSNPNEALKLLRRVASALDKENTDEFKKLIASINTSVD